MHSAKKRETVHNKKNPHFHKQKITPAILRIYKADNLFDVHSSASQKIFQRVWKTNA